MVVIYPAVFTKTKKGYIVSVPDFPLDTQGKDLAEAIYMARDAIGLMGIDFEDDKKPLPKASAPTAVEYADGDIVSLIDVDLAAYRTANEQRTVRRNVSLPLWLNREAERAGINVSAILQEALKVHLNL
jgi:predicted RNase H-like HicB family nuclease